MVMHLIHRWVGIPIALAMLYMSISGVLLNHPGLIAKLDAPAWALPSDMRSVQGGRGLVLAWLPMAQDTVMVGGRGGVFLLNTSTGKTEKFDRGMPTSVYRGAVRTLYKDSLTGKIWAGAAQGAYFLQAQAREWNFAGLPQEVIYFHRSPQGLLAFTAKAIFLQEANQWIPVKQWEEKQRGILRLFFEVHSGAILGKPGRLLYNLVALAMFVMSISGLYVLLKPGHRSFFPKSFRRQMGHLIKYHLTHHRKWGWLLLIPMFLIPATGLWMKAPLSVILFNLEKSRTVVQTDSTRISRPLTAAAWDITQQRFILATNSGLWSAPLSLTQPWTSLAKSLPVHPMGINDILVRGDSVLISSYSGLIWYSLSRQKSFDAMHGELVQTPQMKNAWQGRALGVLNDKIAFSELRRGWFYLDQAQVKAVDPLPAEWNNISTYSLWHYMFEVHNGRILRSWLGSAYLLHNPLVAIGTLLVIISGVWILINRRFKRKSSKKIVI